MLIEGRGQNDGIPPGHIRLVLFMSDPEALELLRAIRNNGAPRSSSSETALHLCNTICPAIQEALGRPPTANHERPANERQGDQN